LTNRFVLAALGTACIGAAAAGGYIAVRQNAATATPVAAESTAPAASAAPSASAPEPSTPDTPAPDMSARNEVAAPVVDTPRPAPKPAVRNTTPQPAAPSARDRVSAGNVSASPNREADQGIQATPPPTPHPPLPAIAPPPPPERTDAVATDRPTDFESASNQTELEELVVPADSVIGLRIQTQVSSERARIEDRVDARVTRDVRVNGAVAIPAGTRAIGSVKVVERGGKFRNQGRLGIRFHTLLLPDNAEIPISSDTIYREGEAPGNESAKRVGGGAAVGSIVGAIIGGSKGALIGGAAGAGAGSASVAAGDRSTATLSAGTEVSVRLLSAVTVTVERE
jgi:hypothetical protein